MNSFQKLFANPTMMIKLVVALCYMALGLYLIINANLLYFLDKAYRPFLAGLFIVYGAFRLYRVVNELKND